MMGVDVKICGLTNYDDAMVAVEAGADYLGFVLYERSPRYVRPIQFVRLVDRLPEGVRVVPVCVNMPADEMVALLQDVQVACVQLHGDEEPEPYGGLPVPYWRAMCLTEGHLAPDPANWDTAARMVLDAAAPGQYGGTGQRTDWARAAEEARRFPMMLAGGLSPDNVAEALLQVRPCGVDTSSGVEQRPGRKDWAAVRRFIEQARRAGEDERMMESGE
jgi:phosphoribosylanthranilate isomerase